MNIVFTADIHIKLGQKNVPTDWSKRRYKEMFRQIGEYIERETVSELIIGGDIFDRLPTLEELEVYFEFLADFKNLPVKILIYSGNHEAVRKNTTFLTYLKNITKATNPNAFILDSHYATAEYEILPYNKLKEFCDKPKEPVARVLFTHVRGEIPPHVQPEVPLELFEQWDTVFAGDLHSHNNCQRNIVYPGSPVTTSFHRELTTTGFIHITDTEWDFVKLSLPQLLRKTVSTVAEMLKTDYHHTIYELEGDMQEMSKISSSTELLDKKIVAKESVSSLGLRPEMTIAEELEEYLKRVLLIEDAKVKKFINKFNDYI